MNINSSEYTKSAYSSNGFSGLASGIDTESIVESMLSNIQNKIDKQKQEQQKLEWKQELYRDIIQQINDFQSKYFDLTSSTSLRMNALFNTMQTKSSSSAVSVSGTSNESNTNFDVQVARLATASKVDSGSIAGNMTTSSANADNFSYDRTIDIKIDGVEKSLKVDFKSNTELSEEEMVQKINDELANNGIDSGVFKAVLKPEVLSYKKTAADGTETIYKAEKDENGNIVKYTGSDGKVYSLKTDENGEPIKDDNGNNKFVTDGDEVLDFSALNENEVKKSIVFSGSKSFEISGSSAGLAIIGRNAKLTATASTVEETDGDGNPVTKTTYEYTADKINTRFTSSNVNGSIDVTLDGIKKSIAINEGENMNDLRDKIQAAFGKTVDIKKADDGWTFSVSGTGRTLSISANADTMKAIGFEGKTTISNRVSRSDTLDSMGIFDDGTSDTQRSFTINGKTIDYTADDTVSSIMNKVNSSGAGVTMSYNDVTGKFSIKANSTGAGFDIELKDDDSGLFSKLGFSVDENEDGDIVGFANVTKGQNAVINLDGMTMERATNGFVYNGVTVTLKSTTGDYDVFDENGNVRNDIEGKFVTKNGSVDNAANVTSTRDSDKIVSVVKDFVNDYNELIKTLNEYTHADPSYKKYPPLTEAQKKEMSEKEIELWEEKAKEGLLRNDTYISKFLSDMRTAMYSRYGSSGLSLSNIGIDSSSDWREYGKLTIDEDALKKAVDLNPDAVKSIFTGDNGIAARLNKVCNQAANTSSGSPGTLVTMAGVKGKGSENDNTIRTRLLKISEKLESLNRLYEKRKTRYWNQFNAMESYINNMNSQSDWLNSMLGY